MHLLLPHFPILLHNFMSYSSSSPVYTSDLLTTLVAARITLTDTQHLLDDCIEQVELAHLCQALQSIEIGDAGSIVNPLVLEVD